MNAQPKQHAAHEPEPGAERVASYVDGLPVGASQSMLRQIHHHLVRSIAEQQKLLAVVEADMAASPGEPANDVVVKAGEASKILRKSITHIYAIGWKHDLCSRDGSGSVWFNRAKCVAFAGREQESS
jgi:hypothetical protein